MSIDAITFVKPHRVGDSACRMLLFIIAENTFNDSGLCRVGQAVLMEDAELSERTLKRKIGVLKALGLIRSHIQPGTGSGRQNDAIELVGFLDWYAEQRGQSAKLAPRGQSAKSRGGKVPMVAPSYKDLRTRDTVQVKVKGPSGKDGSTSKIVEEDTAERPRRGYNTKGAR